ncbi:putative chemotaxis protein CheY [Bradyrhizobium lupini HPC(L)]|uniref:Chemotaxis protein CheY n=1 Tax=Bradyrhizobium lupini HPC(L) TaxID=1229491 RepID=A0ABP2RP32_RHILU|nr:putative chemotaxis protein CheY [Bradyrhizobium lupini HPC(L)]
MGIAERIKVLVVDEQVTSRLLLSEALAQLDSRNISIARDGEDALQTLKRDQHHLVISDFNMPKMDGLALLKEVRSDITMRKMAFVILTAQGDRALVQKAATLGANNVLAKPFTPEKLKRALEAVFGVLEL